MNEALWWACGNPNAMVDELRHKVSDRKLRWYAVACVRRNPPTKFTKFHWDMVKEVEDAAEEGWQLPEWQLWAGEALGALLLVNAFRAAWATADRTLGKEDSQRDESRKAQCGLLRDIFGNPFHPVTFAPEWRTDTVRALAAQMYESRDFGAMPILADALQDAGCDNTEILDHCRGEGPHVRGCWVVDLLLDKA